MADPSLRQLPPSHSGTRPMASHRPRPTTTPPTDPSRGIHVQRSISWPTRKHCSSATPRTSIGTPPKPRTARRACQRPTQRKLSRRLPDGPRSRQTRRPGDRPCTSRQPPHHTTSKTTMGRLLTRPAAIPGWRIRRHRVASRVRVSGSVRSCRGR